MSFSQTIRPLILLVVGLAVGGVGATLFRDSLPGSEGSPEERASKLELELKRAQSRITALEAEQSQGRGDSVLHGVTGAHPKGTVRDGMRDIAQALREGRPVTPEDIFRASQPLMRDLAPLFDRMRVRQEQSMVESTTGALARKYDLDPAQQEQLRQWFERKSKDNAKRWSELIAQDGTRLQDVMRASRDVRPDEGLDQFMPAILSGEKLEQFKSERLSERAERVQQEADRRVENLSSVVTLDEAQRDQVFGLMARNSRDYDPQMAIEGAKGEISTYSTGYPEDAVLSVLRPEQRAAYEAERKRRREAAVKDMEAIGLSLPADWNMFEQEF